jgi:cation diffusion facilitator family transporter
MRTSKEVARKGSSRKAIYAALAGNFLVALTKFVAAVWTGSSSMLSEAIHSLVDMGNELLLLYGLHRAHRKPDAARPLGYGRELYFWSFIVALLVFALGSGAALLQGAMHIVNPRPIEDAYVNYIVLAFALLFEGASWWVSLTEFRKDKGSAGFVEAFRRSKDPTSFMVLFEDSAALIGILIALAGTWAATTFQLPALDGIASILIGLMLGMTAALLAQETKSLLMGEPADPEVVTALIDIASADPAVLKVNGIVTVHIGPSQVLVALSVEFADNLRTADLESKVAEIEDRIHVLHPEVIALFVKPQTPSRFMESRQRRFGISAPLPGQEPMGP